MKLCIVRHGETDWNKATRMQGTEDIPLNDTGREQAIACGKNLADGNWHHVVSSPLSRAQETGSLILNQLSSISHPTVLENPLFIERDFGSGSGLTLAEREARYPDRNFENMESKEAVVARMIEGVSLLGQQHPGENIILVSHGAAIYSLLRHLMDAPDPESPTIFLKNAGITLLDVTDDSIQICYYNQDSDFFSPDHLFPDFQG